MRHPFCITSIFQINYLISAAFSIKKFWTIFDFLNTDQPFDHPPPYLGIKINIHFLPNLFSAAI